MKLYIAFIIALVGGPIFLCIGWKDYKDSKRLMAEGKATTGLVVDGVEKVSRKGRHSYSLTVQYQPENGRARTAIRSVNKEVYQNAGETRVVKLHYLPSDPEIFQVGEKVETATEALSIGGILLLAGLVGLGIAWYRICRRDDGETQCA